MCIHFVLKKIFLQYSEGKKERMNNRKRYFVAIVSEFDIFKQFWLSDNTFIGHHWKCYYLISSSTTIDILVVGNMTKKNSWGEENWDSNMFMIKNY